MYHFLALGFSLIVFQIDEIFSVVVVVDDVLVVAAVFACVLIYVCVCVSLPSAFEHFYIGHSSLIDLAIVHV